MHKNSIQFVILFFSFDGENFTTLPDSQFSHMWTLGLGNYQGNAFTTGCDHFGKNCFNKTEILDMTTLEWSDAPDFPYSE